MGETRDLRVVPVPGGLYQVKNKQGPVPNGLRGLYTERDYIEGLVAAYNRRP